MAENALARIIEHNNWANLQYIRACSGMREDLLDAQPRVTSAGACATP